MDAQSIKLERVGYFVCPNFNRVIPVKIPEGYETVEILTGGKIRFDLDGEERIFGKGSIFWHKGGEFTIYKTFADDPYRCIVFYFQVPHGERPGPRVSSWENPDAAISFAEECHEAFHSGNADLAALAEYAYSTIRWKAQISAKQYPPECPAALLDACDYIERHLDQKLTPEQIASYVNLSRPYLFALFRKHFSVAPCHYIQQRRIARAKVMLSAGNDLSIKEIAMNCGFDILEVFYRQFKKHTGQTPAEYRVKYTVRPL